MCGTYCHWLRMDVNVAISLLAYLGRGAVGISASLITISQRVPVDTVTKVAHKNRTSHNNLLQKP